MSHILINAETRQPVPLPYHSQDHRGDPMTVVDFYMKPSPSTGRIITSEGWNYYPGVCGLEIITEEAFMAERSSRTDKEA